MKLIFDEQRMTEAVKDLLSMKKKSTWKIETIKESLTIDFKGNCFTVQENIFNWLNTHERWLNRKILKGED